jgi:hypothetical protein
MSYGTDEDRKAGRIAIGLVAAAVVAGGGWWYWQRAKSADPADAAALTGSEVATVTSDDPPPIEHPLEAAPQAITDGQAITDPDQLAQRALDEVFGGALGEWLITEQLARRLVATTDNLARNTRIEPLRPLRAPAGPFIVERQVLDASIGSERIQLAEANFARYDAMVALLARTDAATAATAYRRIYPQLQAAYEDLGYPGRYFNDRLVAVIDHLLATPEPGGTLLLEQPKVLYVYADPGLEALSPGQKLLLRIGNTHARTVKNKLREFRALVATAAPANNEN